MHSTRRRRDFVRTSLASRAAFSRMERIPQPVSAEHSMYATAPIFVAISFPCDALGRAYV
jgi:hypothetical protein